MDHIAIMKKSWCFIPKILSGEKKIESRWYKFKVRPWNIVFPGDSVYFKNSGEPVIVKAAVDHVLQFSDLTASCVEKVLSQYGQKDGITQADMPFFFELFKDKKCCILIFLKDPESVVPFQINKKGYGAMSAWISVPDVNKLKYI